MGSLDELYQISSIPQSFPHFPSRSYMLEEIPSASPQIPSFPSYLFEDKNHFSSSFDELLPSEFSYVQPVDEQFLMELPPIHVNYLTDVSNPKPNTPGGKSENLLRPSKRIRVEKNIQEMETYLEEATSCCTTSTKRGSCRGRNTNLKPRAKQAHANDPQSIAARQRRERISQRLKTLQNLVPNGTKVDLVTMLEKAINYVKFMQLQVKVLTADEYLPIKHPDEVNAETSSCS